jgi:hypothetical protein
MDGWMDGKMYGWTDEWIEDEKINIHIYSKSAVNLVTTYLKEVLTHVI